MAFPFLTAHWKNLFLATYAVEPALLQPHLAKGLSLDLRDGQAFVSLVAFEFLNTRVLGVPWPGYRNFGELNLRFYVRHGDERGVSFLREFVPQRLVAWMARRLYNEPYLAAPLSTTRQEDQDTLHMEYRLLYAGREHRISVLAGKPAFRPSEDSDEHFFKEHRWGFGSTRKGKGIRYEVIHPVWDVYPIRSFQVDVDFASLYGAKWGFLAQQKPVSTVLAVGSPVAVYPWGTVVG